MPNVRIRNLLAAALVGLTLSAAADSFRDGIDRTDPNFVKAALGLMLIYLVFFSSLPATMWNWLIVPFNPLPLVLWKWRRTWALPFAGVLAAWLACMALAPHRMTDPAYCALVAAYIALCARIALRENAQVRDGNNAQARDGGAAGENWR